MTKLFRFTFMTALCLCGFVSQPAWSDPEASKLTGGTELDQAFEKKMKAMETYYSELRQLKNPTRSEQDALKAKILQPAEAEYQATRKKFINTNIEKQGIRVAEPSGQGVAQETDSGEPDGPEDNDDSAEPADSPESKKSPTKTSATPKPASSSKSRGLPQDKPEPVSEPVVVDGSQVPGYLEFPGKKSEPKKPDDKAASKK